MTIKVRALILTFLIFAIRDTSAIVSFSYHYVKNDFPEQEKISFVNRSFDKAVKAKTFNSVLVDDENTKWFLTEDGIVSFDGNKWNSYNRNRKIPKENINDFAYESSSNGQKIWIATPQGAAVVSVPLNAKSGANKYHTGNTNILSNNILAVAIGKSPLRWFGTDKGISAFKNDTWLSNTYQRKYRETMFREFPITSMATTPYGDTLYAGTEGAGVARVFRNKVDAISGASEYAQWGPIDIPSDKVYSICITPDGTQWFGTDRGVAKHTGQRTTRNWKVYDTNNGLVNNFIQAIAFDKKGNIWFGTQGGVSVFDGTIWTSYTVNDGLNSNNILCITTDNNGIVWLGTDNGVISFNNGEFVLYK